MCGLFGWMEKKGKQLPRKHAMLSMLAALNDERGGDSYGFYTGKGDLVKGLGEAFWVDHETKKGLTSERLLIGHTRKATTGKVNKDNAHPFHIGDVIGAHNGMVMNHAELNAAHGRNYDVDSQHIFGHLSEGLNSFSDIEAYGAITFAIEGDEEVYFGKFNAGELAVAETKWGWVWSSDESHLEKALGLADVKHSRVGMRQGALYSMTPHCLFKMGIRLDFASPWKTYGKSVMLATGTNYSLYEEETEEEIDRLMDYEGCDY